MHFSGQISLIFSIKNKSKLTVFDHRTTNLPVVPLKRSRRASVNQYIFQSLNISSTMARLVGWQCSLTHCQKLHQPPPERKRLPKTLTNKTRSTNFYSRWISRQEPVPPNDHIHGRVYSSIRKWINRYVLFSFVYYQRLNQIIIYKRIIRLDPA